MDATVASEDGFDPALARSYLNNPQGRGLWRMTTRINVPSAWNARPDYAEAMRQSLSRAFVRWVAPESARHDFPEMFEALDFESSMFRRAALDERRRARKDGRESPVRHFNLIASRLRDELQSSLRGTLKPPENFSQPDIRRLNSIRVKEFPNLRWAVQDEEAAFSSVTPAHQFTIIYPRHPRPRRSPHDPDFVTLSLSRGDLEKLGSLVDGFIALWTCNSEHRISKVFTPEELLHIPYFRILWFCLECRHKLTEDSRIRADLVNATRAALAGNAVDSIRNSGLGLESLLDEIYEQCFREKAPSFPLGQELRELGAKALKITRGLPASTKGGTDDKEIQSALALVKSHGDKAVRTALGMSIALTREMNAVLNRIQTLELAGTNPQDRPPHPFFSPEVRDNIERAINLRNAVAHRTTQRITLFEAALAARGLLNLVDWWSKRDELVDDWDAPLSEVLGSILERGPKIVLT